MLKNIIINKIKNEGPISFKQFMEMALYYPEYGYYTSSNTDIGRKGDFYTSPHLHSIFGTMIGIQIEEMWEFMNGPSEFYIIEIGAGMGYLSVDILKYLNKTKFFNSLRFVIVERNPYIKEKQKSILKSYNNKITWIDSLDEITSLKGCILSNELIDSFPVYLIRVYDNDIKEVYVDVNEDSFFEVLKDCKPDLLNYLKDFGINIYDGYKTEINLIMKDWLDNVYTTLKEGFLFTIDYGYPSWDYYNHVRYRGTLQCYYKHQTNENPYQNLGNQDITAHVNFSALKKWGKESGLKTIGYCPQGTFLISLKIDEVINEMYLNNNNYQFEVAKIKGLILPDGMGESHKVLIQYKGKGSPQLSGFSLKNKMEIL